MDAFAAVADPVRRAILTSLRGRTRTAGDLAADFEISRPAVSRHLRVLRESGLVAANVSGREWVYALADEPFGALESWLAGFRAPAEAWGQRLDALETEVRRTTRDRRRSEAATAAATTDPTREATA